YGNCSSGWHGVCAKLCLIFLLLPGAARAQFNYETNNGAIEITHYTGNNGTAVIPSTLNGLPVVSIGYAAFSYVAVSNLTIPTSITNIENSAFMVCNRLKVLDIPGSVLRIGANAFAQCGDLQEVRIHDGVPSIGDQAFFFCNTLGKVTIAD